MPIQVLRRVGLRSLGALLLWVGSVGALAVPVTVAVSAQGNLGGTPVIGSGCGDAFTVGVTLSCTPPDTPTTILKSSAKATSGAHLHGRTEVLQRDGGPGVLAVATASWTDERVLFRPLLHDTTVRVRLTLDGTQMVDYAGPDELSPVASAITFIRYNVRRNGSTAAADFDELLVRRALLDYGSLSRASTGIQRTTHGVDGAFGEVAGFPAAPLFVFDLLAGTRLFDFGFQFATNAEVRAGFAGSASTDYFNTASVDGFQFIDSTTGEDITASLGVSFGSGERYGAPEPGGLALVGLSLVGLGCQRRRRGFRSNE